MPEYFPEYQEEQKGVVSDGREIGPKLGGWAVEIVHSEQKERGEHTSLPIVTEGLRHRREKLSAYQQAVDPSPTHVAERLLEIISDSGVREAVPAGDYDPLQFDGLIGELNSLKGHALALLEQENPTGEDVLRKQVGHISREPLKLLMEAPLKKLRFAYFSEMDEGGAVSETLQTAISGNEDITSLQMAADVISKAYEWETTASLIEHNRMDDPLVDLLANHPECHNLLVRSIGNNQDERQDGAERMEQAYREAGDMLAGNLGLPADLSTEFISALKYRTTKSRKAEGVMPGREIASLKESLLGAKTNIEALGAKEIAKLRQACGIVNLDGYSTAQLQRMANIIDADPAAVEYIQAGDCTVFLTDAKGDHNGAYGAREKSFGHDNGRGLYFELQQPSDFYRHMLFLQERDIKPSTVIVNAHGKPGAMYFGKEGEGRFNVSTKEEAVVQSFNQESGGLDVALHAAGGIERLVNDFMQDSRGIDDNETSVGRRKLILLSCSQGQPEAVARTKPDGSAGLSWESTAEAIAKVANIRNLDIYAPSRPVTTLGTESGIAFSEVQSNRIPSTKVASTGNGKVLTSYVDEIILRR